ncbi:MAG: acyl-CoA thioesterase [Aureispira sp.]|nr:acyl-CoA thioesterase [Aureispira sp.]
MTVKDKIENSITRVFKAVLPNTTNHYNTLFGGTALQMMDEVAFICATRFSRKRMVTVTSDQIHFKHSIPAGTLIELVAKVVYLGNTSVKVQVEIYLEEMYEDSRMKAITGMFTFVAIDRDRNPTQVIESFVKE